MPFQLMSDREKGGFPTGYANSDVEDEQKLLRDIAKGLMLKGYAVDQADNGNTGCQMALDEEYDLIVLDLNLPGLDGVSILKMLRQERPQTKALLKKPEGMNNLNNKNCYRKGKTTIAVLFICMTG